MAVVEVDWIDSNGHSGWQSERDWHEDAKSTNLACRSVGYLFRDEDDRIVLLMSVAATGGLADALIIPKVAVIGYKRLRAKGTSWETKEKNGGRKAEPGHEGGSQAQGEQAAVHEAAEGQVGE